MTTHRFIRRHRPGIAVLCLLLSLLCPATATASSLAEAAWQGEVEDVEAWLRRGADVNEVDADGWTPLMRAVAVRRRETGPAPEAIAERAAIVARLLAEPGVDPNAREYRGRTALHLAVEEGWPTLVQALLAAPQIDPDRFDGEAMTPLMRAASDATPASEEVLAALLADPRVDPRLRNARGEDALGLAYRRTLALQPALYEALLASAPPLPAVEPATLALLRLVGDLWSRPSLGTLRQLLHDGADPNAVFPNSGSAPPAQLLYSHIGMNPGSAGDAVDMFAELTASPRFDVNAAGTNGLTLAMRAARRDDVAMLDRLRGIDWNRRDAEGRTVLHHAADPATLAWLLARPGVDVNLGEPLEYHVGRGDLAAADHLFANPQVVITPAAVIASINHNNGADLEMVTMLLDAGRFDARKPVPGLLRQRGAPLQFGVIQAFCGWAEWPEDEGRARIRRFLRSPHIDITLPYATDEHLEPWADAFCSRRTPWVVDEVRAAVAAAG